MAPHSSLLVCPKNLKECIDWVLRVATGRDDQNGTVNINKLKDALEAVLPDFDSKSIDLTQLVQGLCLFMGYPSCLCSLKANVDKSLQDISKKLKEDFKAVKSCVNLKTLNLNCSCDSKKILCKCCVIRCIKAVKKCKCVKNTSTVCKCQEPKEKCCKDFLSGLEACLSLLNLKGDMGDCNCGPDCCDKGVCTTSGCTVCSPKNFPDNAMTGLGICPMNPRKLAERLEKFFETKTGGSSGCSCQCGSGSTPGTSCCCLACQSCSSKKSCFCSSSGSSTGCSCDKVPKKPSECPRKKFCEAIQNVKVVADSSEMTCCEGGQKCHCQLPGSGSSKCSGSNCCVVDDKSGTGSNNHYQSLKCLIRRLVKFFKDLSLDSPDKCSKLCCELLCVLKISYFLKDLYNDSKKWAGKKSCGKCSKGKGTGKNCTQGTGKGSKCCNGNISKCTASDCCQGCPECNAIKLGKALQTLRFAGPCGLDLYRLLKDLLNFCSNVMHPNKDFIHDTVLKAVNSCPSCQKSGTDSSGWKPCTCSSSSSSCKACPKLLKDSKLMSILRHGYVSSYDSSNAKWEDLCPKSSSSKCCCGRLSCSCSKSSSSCCKSSSVPCDPKNCCPDCNVRSAAKIFLGMLPCLYYGLKILHARSKYGSGFAGWHDISVNSDDKPSSDLGRFLYAWGYDLRPLKSKKGSEFFSLLENLFGSDSSGPLQKLSTLVTDKYFVPSRSPSISSSHLKPSPPSTVREMLLWLYGLRFQKHFSDIVENCKSLCSPFGNSFHPDAFCYYIYTCCFLLPVAIISLIEDSSSAQTAFSSSSDWTSFSYPEDLSSLFEKLCEYARKIFVALAFLYYQCERVGSQGGWNDCAFGRGCAEKVLQSSSGSPATSASSLACSSCKHSGAYLCTAINKDTVHDHCQKGSCLGSSGSCSSHTSGKCTPCPHPLMRFLLDGSSDSDSQSQSQDSSPFRLPFSFARIDFSKTPPAILPSSDTFLTMGFLKKNLPSPGKKGEKLYHDIYGFCKDGFYPLTRLVQFILCVSRRPPETLGELFGFFRKFAEALNSKPELSSTFVNWINGEPGEYSGSDLKKAIQNLYGSKTSHSGDHSVANLFSLSECHAPKAFTCGPYLHPLTEEVSGVFTKELCSMYLSWICHLTKDFKSLLEEFHKEAEKKFSSCCKSCPKIVECPCALPFIYSHGFTFHSPSTLNCVDAQGTKHPTGHAENETGKCTLKSCSQFLAQLKLVAEGDPFKTLIAEIESFLWSIREPFFLFVLAFWAFVISYFLYVHLYKLDILELNSHDHPAWSFKILPSTLFSDASSKLKDLSYFTL